MRNLNTSQKRTLFIVPIVLIVLASAGLATAQGHGLGQGKGQKKGCAGNGPAGFGPGHRIEMMAHRLDLSDDQKNTIQGIFENSRQDGVEKRKDLMRLRNQLKGEMLKDSPSEKSVLSINSKMGALKTEMKALKLKTRLAVREELTSEQRDKMLVMGGFGGNDGHGKKGGQGKKGGHGGSHGCGNCDGPGKGARQGGGGFHHGGNFNNE